MNPRLEYNAALYRGSTVKADLVLGEYGVAVEFKFEPRYPSQFGWKSKILVVLWEEVYKDRFLSKNRSFFLSLHIY